MAMLAYQLPSAIAVVAVRLEEQCVEAANLVYRELDDEHLHVHKVFETCGAQIDTLII